MPPVCPHCHLELLTTGVPAPGKCITCGWPDAKPPKAVSSLERFRLTTDAATEVWLARLAVMRITASDTKGADDQRAAIEHLTEARRLFQEACIPWPEIQQ